MAIVNCPSEPCPTVAPAEVERAGAEVLRTWGDFKCAWHNKLEKAVENGKRVRKLREACFHHGVQFTKWLRSNGIPKSKAYDNMNLAEVWDEAQAIMAAGGVRVELTTPRDLYLLVTGSPGKPALRSPRPPQADSAPAQGEARVAEVGGGVATGGDRLAQYSPGCDETGGVVCGVAESRPDAAGVAGPTPPAGEPPARPGNRRKNGEAAAQERAVIGHVSDLYPGRTVRLIQPPQFTPMTLDLTDEIFVVVPTK